MQVASGPLAKPDHYDPLLEILRERGCRHEQAFINHLEDSGFEVTTIDSISITDKAIDATTEAMREGKVVIVQGALRQERWCLLPNMDQRSSY